MTSALLTEVDAGKLHPEAMTMKQCRAQELWAARQLKDRSAVLRKARHLLSERTSLLSRAISSELSRTPADTRVAEILPLLAACQFLERNANRILAPRKLGRRGLPFWLASVRSEVHRVPLGLVLVIGPANYPLFLPGVQTLQALAAGNSVTWKPGRGGQAVAQLFAEAMSEAGLPEGLLHITDETVEAAHQALAEGPAKVFFTGSAEVGRVLMRQLAETLTPSVMELSGCDAVIVLPSANLIRVVKALAFGMRLNGSATCMAPRRVLLIGASLQRRGDFLSQLLTALRTVGAVSVAPAVREQLESLLADAKNRGAYVHGDLLGDLVSPIVVTDVTPEMGLAQADVFAPVLAVIDLLDETAMFTAQEACPFALTAAIFGDESEAIRVAAQITAGSVLINDIIVPTADPRAPFGGRRGSGFGVTRGAEGLLEMTAVKTVAIRRGSSERHFEKTTTAHEGLFDGLIAAAHGGSWVKRLLGMKQVAAAAGKLNEKGEEDDGR